eukprot:c13035_g3_i2.p1 GENE.c13035_g3_i2~~c13035_g3_i2.p1  ORF type:complete len:885 (+),score=198.41 c13035_g3_i2:26-2656(+)
MTARCLVFVCVVALSAASAVPDLTQYVNTRAGSLNTYQFSTGNIFPITAVPNGFNHWTVMSELTTDARFYNDMDRTFFGVRCTHTPSPWIGDYGWFYISPQTGPFVADAQASSPYNPDDSTFSPHYFETYLERFQSSIELSPTNHGAIIRISFPKTAQTPSAWDARRFVLHMPSAQDFVAVHGSSDINATTSGNSGGVPTYLLFTMEAVSNTPYPWDPTSITTLSTSIATLLQSNGVLSTNIILVNMTSSPDNTITNLTLAIHQSSASVTNAKNLDDPLSKIFSSGSLQNALAQAGMTLTLSLITSQPHDRFTTYVRLHVDPAPISSSTANGAAVFEFNTPEVIIRVATSFISMDMADIALKRELPATSSFEDIQLQAQQEWNSLLSRVTIEDAFATSSPSTEKDSQTALDHTRTFYTGMFRGLLWPRNATEIDGEGKLVHYSAYDAQGRSFYGQLVTDHGFWDAYRTIYPLINLLYSDRAGNILNGWINAYKEGGWLPKWASPGYRSSMTGCFCDLSLADAILKNIPGLDIDGAVSAIMQDTFVIPPATTNGGVGRTGLDWLIQLGYIPDDAFNQAVSRTLDQAFLDHAFSDLCVALNLTSKQIDCAYFRARSMNASTSLFDNSTMLMRPRNKTGAWLPDFDEFEWSMHYTEGGPWQYRFGLPHDVDTLATLYGGKTKLCRTLDRIFESNIVHPTGYGNGQYIHEMAEMQLLHLGQYEQNNQPVHHELYLYAAAGELNSTQYWANRVMNVAYSPTNYPGDEDNGEMASWYVFSALGFYPLAPSQPSYVLGVPLFRKATIHLPAGASVTISVDRESVDQFNFPCVTWNGQQLTDHRLPHSALIQGGNLVFSSVPCNDVANLKMRAQVHRSLTPAEI